MLVHTLNTDGDELAHARRVVRRALHAHGCPERHIDDVVTVIDEMLTAAAEVGSEQVDLRVTGADRGTRIEIEDHLPQWTADGDTSTAFRSRLLHALTSALGSKDRPDGRRMIFAEVSL
jgi:hypothetical protein